MSNSFLDLYGTCKLLFSLAFCSPRMVEFFQKMKEFMETCDVGSSVVENLTELKKTFCISSAMFYKFKR